MKIAVFGGTGLTGNLVIRKALEKGYVVNALTRDASRITFSHPSLKIIEGDPYSPLDVEKTLRGTDAVIHCLGIGGKGDGKQTSLVSDSVQVITTLMEKRGPQRIICMSNVGAGHSGTWFYKAIVLPVFLRWLKPIIEDKDKMESILRESSVDWVSVRLPNITSGSSRPLRISQSGKGIGLSITTSSVADFLLAQLESNEFLHTNPSVSN